MRRGGSFPNRGGLMNSQGRINSFSLGNTSTNSQPEASKGKKQSYVSWNKEMDSHLAIVLADQMAQGNKCDGDSWKPQALHAAVTYLNAKLNLSLTKDNIKNRLKNWKKYFNVVYDIQTKQSGFTWDEERKMIVVTSDEFSAWTSYVESHPEARGLQNKVIENWEDIVLLCGKDRATGQGAETFEESLNAMDGEEENCEGPIHETMSRVRPSSSTNQPSSSDDSSSSKRKKAKKNLLGEAVSAIANSFQKFVTSRNKQQEKPSGIEIHKVVSEIQGLTTSERYQAIRKLMNGDPEEFNLLKSLPHDEKKDWAVESRRDRQRASEDDRQTIQDPLSTPAGAQREHASSTMTPITTNPKKRCPPTIGKVAKILLDVSHQNDSDSANLTPQKKLLNNIDTVGKVVMDELRKLERTPSAKKAERAKKMRTLMSMR